MDIETTAERLYEILIKESPKMLTDSQKQKFHYACRKAILENPELDFNGLKIAAKIYRNFILDFPHIDLGGINAPSK